MDTIQLSTPFVYKLIFSAFIINFLWEYAHLPLYRCIEIWNRSQKIALPLLAAIGDAVIVIVIVALSVIIAEQSGILEPVLFWFVLIGLSIILSVFLEGFARIKRLWEYRSAMPLIHIGPVRLGISPFLQISFTPLLSVLIVMAI